MPKSRKSKWYTVEKILDKKLPDKRGEEVKYKIKWLGYNEITWEPLSNCANCVDLIQQFEAEYAKKRSGRLASKKASTGIKKQTLKKTPPSRASRNKVATPVRPSRSRLRRCVESQPQTPSSSSASNVKNGQNNRTPTFSSALAAIGSSPTPRFNVIATRSRRQKRPNPPPVVIDESEETEPSSSSSNSIDLPEISQPRQILPSRVIPSLSYIVKQVLGIYDDGTHEKVVVLSNTNVRHLAYIKAVARQNPDLMLDFLLARMRPRTT